MSTGDSTKLAEDGYDGRFARATEELRKVRSSGLRGYWGVYLVAVCYGVVAWHQGWEALGLYLMLLVLIFMLHEMTVRRIERQIDAVLGALGGRQK